MPRLDMSQALSRAEAFKDLGRPVPRATRLHLVKQLEARLTWPLLFRQIKFNEAVVDVLQNVVSGLEARAGGGEIRVRYQQHHEGIAALRRDMASLQQQIVEAEKRLARLQVAQRGSQTQVEVFLGEVRRSLPGPPDLERLAAAPTAWEGLQNAFTDQLRGSYEEVQERFRVYLDDLPAALDEQHPVLDIGCGRGEWLDLLRSKGVPGYGIDRSESAAHRAAESGLDVRAGDALEHLRGLPEHSLGMVTAFHLVEHLPLDSLVELVDLALRALRPGGRLVLETPNPNNVAVGASTFWLDPTHERPIPPSLLSFLVEMRGFADVETRVLARGVRPLRLPEGEGADPALTRLVEAVNRHFEVGEDYAILATRL
jgi:SAM-dependent methyltransferase